MASVVFFYVLVRRDDVCYAACMRKVYMMAALVGGVLVSCGSQTYIHAPAHENSGLVYAHAQGKQARNVILMIGDGMGAEHVWAAWLCNKGKLNLTAMPVTGFSVTTSASHAITDSAAGGTAIACGCKTANGQVGVNETGKPVESLAEQMRRRGKATGIVVTKAVTDATPASFYAHVQSRKDTPAIADALTKAGFDVVAGGGAEHFSDEQKSILETSCRMFELAAPGDCEPASKRGDWLPQRVEQALQVLQQDEDGFFLMVEGSKIDMSAHVNDLPETICETLDFDRAVGVVLRWMQGRSDTLLVVTADHQTGGLSLLDGDKQRGTVKGHFSTFRHSGVAVPVYAAGCGAAAFTGVQENTQLAPKIRHACGLTL